MDFRENKIEWGIGLLAAVMVFGLFRLFGSYTGTPEREAQDISYEMGRPKSEMVGEFGLGDREIDRRYVNPYAHKNDKKVAVADAKNVKAAPIVAAKPHAQHTKAAARPVMWVKRPRVDINVIGKDQRHLSGDGTDRSPYQEGQNPNLAADGKNNDAGTDKEDKKDILSPDQWRALLSAQPTKENMNKLVEALSKGEVDANTFYSISDGLLKSQKKEDQALAIYGLGRVSTAKTFAFIAIRVNTLPADIQPSAQQLMMSYAAPAKHAALKQALQMNDPNVAMKAAQVVLAGVQAAKNGGSPVSDPRQGRGDIRQSSSVSAFASFAPIFQKWAASGDASLQGIASQILGLLPTAQA